MKYVHAFFAAVLLAALLATPMATKAGNGAAPIIEITAPIIPA